MHGGIYQLKLIGVHKYFLCVRVGPWAMGDLSCDVMNIHVHSPHMPGVINFLSKLLIMGWLTNYY